MLQRLKSSFWSFLSVLVRAVVSLVINKLFAVFYGPNGITLYSHFQNLISIVTTVPDGGVNVGAIKFLAPARLRSATYKRYFWASFLLNLLCIGLALLLIFSFPGYFLDVFLDADAQVWRWGLYFAAGVCLLTLNVFLLSVLLSQRALKWHMLSTAAGALAGVLALYVSRGVWPLEQVLLLVLGAQASVFILTLAILGWQRLLPSVGRLRIPCSVYRGLGKYILMAISAVVCLKLTNFYIRDYVIAQFNLYQTGLWQAVVKVSESYSAVYTSLVGMLVYPRMAALANQHEALRKYTRATFLLVLPALAVGLLVVYLLRDWVLLLLFNQDFVQAGYLFDYQLLGDFFRMWSIILTNLMVIRTQVRLYIAWQVGSALLYIILVYLLLEPLGLEGVTMAHALRYAATLLFAVLYYNKYIRP